MQFLVVLKIGKIDKFLVTLLACVISLTFCVYFSVLFQGLSSFEINLTNITNVWHLVGMGYHVRFQTPKVFELGFAKTASIGFLIGMELHVQF